MSPQLVCPLRNGLDAMQNSHEGMMQTSPTIWTKDTEDWVTSSGNFIKICHCCWKPIDAYQCFCCSRICRKRLGLTLNKGFSKQTLTTSP